MFSKCGVRCTVTVNTRVIAKAGGRSGSTSIGECTLYGKMDMLKTLKSSATTKKAELLPVPTVGETLLEEFLKPLDLSQNASTRAPFVPRATSTKSSRANAA
jgi:hypothetical protein